MHWCRTYPYKLSYLCRFLNFIPLAVKKKSPAGKPIEYKANTAVDNTVIT